MIEKYLWGLLSYLYMFTNNYGLSLVFFAVIIKIILYYPTHQQFKSMKEMQSIQPEIKKLQEKYKSDPKRMQQEQMLLFKKYKINPLGGCLPLIIQLPILWGIWHVITKHIGEFEKASFLWINPAYADKFHFKVPVLKIMLIGGSLAQPDFILLILYAFSMYLSQKVTVTDPATAKTQSTMTLMMPVLFAFILAKFPSALILYWLIFNILSIFQQILVMRQPAGITIVQAEAQNQVTSGGKKI